MITNTMVIRNELINTKSIHPKSIVEAVVDLGKTNCKTSDEPYRTGSSIENQSKFNNGIIIVSANYKDGSQDGRYEAFHENGELKLKTTYKDGKENPQK